MKEGYKQTKIGVIPQDWMIDNLGTLSKVYDGTHSTPTYVDEGIPFYSVEQLTTVGFNKTKFISEEVFNKENKRVKLEQGDILMTRIGDIGTARYIDWDVNASFYVSLALIKPLNNECNFKYLSFFINSDIFKNELHKRTLHVAFPKKINLGDISKCLVMLPPIEEQIAIANCLSTWDEAIEKQQKLIEAKEIRHKALMQKLLSGKKRLPGFTDEWKEVKLGDFANSYSGLSGKNKDDFGTGKPYISYMNVFSNSIINNDIYDLVSISDDENQNKVQYGDILFTVSSETATEAGMVSVYLNESSEDVYLNSFCFGVRLQTLVILNPRFASFLLRFDDFRKEVFKLAQGSTRYNISKSGILNIKFKIPTLEEQLSITKILESTEKEIEIEKQKLDQLKEQKKALMQKLLTGKVRLPLNN